MISQNITAVDVPHSYVRKLGHHDEAILLEHFARLDNESLRMRFGATLSGESLKSHARGCFSPGCTNHGFFVDGVLRAVAELHQPEGWTSDIGEAAFSVESEWREHGIATELFSRTLRAARNRGVKRLVISCLAWNKPMQTLARKFQAEFKWEEGEIIGTVVTQPASIASFYDECIQDGYGLVSSWPLAFANSWRRRRGLFPFARGRAA